MDVVVRYPRSLIAGRLIVRDRDSNVVRRVKPSSLVQFIDNGLDRVARVVDIIDD